MNWSQYNTNLMERGNINFWISKDVDSWWYCKNRVKRGHPFVYSDQAIEACLMIGYLFHLPLRMVEGFINSIFQRKGINLKVPCYTQLSRRMSKIKLPKITIKRREPLHIAIDSTGLKVYGESEWKVRIHGPSKRRTWKKLHLAIDVKTLNITHSLLTEPSLIDAHAIGPMLANTKPDTIQSIFGDGAYDKAPAYQVAHNLKATMITPPSQNARLQRNIVDPAKLIRDRAIEQIREWGNNKFARNRWKTATGYHLRSLAETTMYRFKNTFTHRLRHKLFKNQKAEVAIKVKILNALASIGIPRTA